MNVSNTTIVPSISWSDWPHIIIVLCSLTMIASLLQPNTHLDAGVWMAWFVPFILIIQAYILWGFSKLD